MFHQTIPQPTIPESCGRRFFSVVFEFSLDFFLWFLITTNQNHAFFSLGFLVNLFCQESLACFSPHVSIFFLPTKNSEQTDHGTKRANRPTRKPGVRCHRSLRKPGPRSWPWYVLAPWLRSFPHLWQKLNWENVMLKPLAPFFEELRLFNSYCIVIKTILSSNIFRFHQKFHRNCDF